MAKAAKKTLFKGMAGRNSEDILQVLGQSRFLISFTEDEEKLLDTVVFLIGNDRVETAKLILLLMAGEKIT